MASEGGFPIVVDGKLIGAIGASGGTAPQDGVMAKAGLDAVTRTERRHGGIAAADGFRSLNPSYDLRSVRRMG